MLSFYVGHEYQWVAEIKPSAFFALEFYLRFFDRSEQTHEYVEQTRVYVEQQVFRLIVHIVNILLVVCRRILSDYIRHNIFGLDYLRLYTQFYS